MPEYIRWTLSGLEGAMVVHNRHYRGQLYTTVGKLKFDGAVFYVEENEIGDCRVTAILVTQNGIIIEEKVS